MGAVKERNYLWDNIKAILIFLVVLGHLLEGFRPFESYTAELVDYWIYTFHMPAFIFVSGFLAKSYCKDGKVRAEKVGLFIAYYAIFQLALYGVKYLMGVKINLISLFNPGRGMWYLLAMIFYYLMIPVIEKLPSYVTLTVFTALAFLIGFEPKAGTLLSIHRIFVFAPFFFLGYYITSDMINKLRSVNAVLRTFIGLALMACSVAIWYLQGIKNFPLGFFFGKSNLIDIDKGLFVGSIFRAQALFIALLMTFGLLLVVPGCKLFISYAGKNSLSVYIFHLPVVVLLMDTEFMDELVIDAGFDVLVLALVAAAITALLSVEIFEYPFKWIQMGVNKLYKKG